MAALHSNVGEIMMYCQLIEENVKRILSHMRPGNPNINRLAIENEKMTLGKVIMEMKELDERSRDSFFSSSDYDKLFGITKTRNEYAHGLYTQFCYLDNKDEFDASLLRCYNHSLTDKAWLSALYDAVEDARLAYE